MTVFIGIDPGLNSGAWGCLDHNSQFIDCGDIIAIDGRIDVIDLKARLLLARSAHDCEIIVENVFVMPGQGMASTGRFMRAAGAIEAVCQLTATTHFVRPGAWKKAMGLDPDKNYSLDMARELWPTAPLKLKKHHGRAEALLIAEWLRRELAV